MLKEQFFPVLFFVYAAQFPRKHSRDGIKGNYCPQTQGCLKAPGPGFLTVPTSFSSRTTIVGIRFSLTSQAGRKERGSQSDVVLL